MESDLIPYSAVQRMPARSVLVLAPHPDDEVFGCAGAIVSHVHAGTPVKVVILTDGAGYGDSDTRQKESLAAAEVLGYGTPDFWLLPDRGLVCDDALRLRVISAIESAGADLVYAPSPHEVHPDHIQTAQLAIAAVSQCGPTVRLAFYEVGAPLRPNLLLDITGVQAAKATAMQCFTSQLAHQDYASQVTALNTYRTYTLPKTVLAAEGYWVVSSSDMDYSPPLWRMVSASAAVPPETRLALAVKPDRPARVAILLCTLHGHLYLEEQLASIEAQTDVDWTIWISDDGSDYRTHEILDRYRQRLTSLQLMVQPGPANGFASNFLALVCNTDIEADYFAYSDQDDIWNPDKLSRAVQSLSSLDAAPALYCSRTLLVDQANRPLGLSRDFPRPPSFRNALVQNMCSGNTLVFNQAARALLVKAGSQVKVPAHDWWTYLLVTGCGGQVIYDRNPTVRYRQHEGNLIGATRSWRGTVLRLQQVVGARFSNWNRMNLQALRSMREHLSSEHQVVYDAYLHCHDPSPVARLMSLYRAKVYRQTARGDLALFIAAFLNKL
ncbi:MAG: glycosyltransferase [Betaproteobacteria bacterium]|nr:glycosyltransferase [Betaproteobacteria bacterium]